MASVYNSATSIRTNIVSLNSQRLMGINADNLSKSVERISSGLRINRASDDAAGLAISESLRSDTTALNKAVQNANDGVSMLNVAEGALSQQDSILIRLRELASQATTGTVSSTQRQSIQLEFNALRSEIDRITATTSFNGQNLIDGSLASTVTSSNHIMIQVGLDSTTNSRIDLNQLDIFAISSTSLGINTLSVTSAANALTAMTAVNSALNTVISERGKVGAVQNRLSRAVSNMLTTVQNLTSAESSIRDTDIAAEVANMTRNQILVQTSTAMVGQANLIPRYVLQLLA